MTNRLTGAGSSPVLPACPATPPESLEMVAREGTTAEFHGAFTRRLQVAIAEALPTLPPPADWRELNLIHGMLIKSSPPESNAPGGSLLRPLRVVRRGQVIEADPAPDLAGYEI